MLYLTRGEDGLIRWTERALDTLSDSSMSVEWKTSICGAVLEDRGFTSSTYGVYLLQDRIAVKVCETGVVVNDLNRGITVMEFGLEDREGWSGLWESIRWAWFFKCKGGLSR